MRLLHYGKQHLKVIKSVPSCAYKAAVNAPIGKPIGLWVSVEGEDDWRSWCEAESFNLEHLACATELVLRDDHNILLLSGADDIDALHREYAVEQFPGMSFTRETIDWPRIADKFGGIIIAPYVWSRRLDGAASAWYYGWDCASGCIWNADEVADLRPVEINAAA